MGEIYIYRDKKRGRVVVSVPLPIEKRDPEKGPKRGRVTEIQIYASQHGGDFQKAVAAAIRRRDELATRFWGDEWRLLVGRNNRVPKRQVRTGRQGEQPEPGVRFYHGTWHASWTDWSSGQKKVRTKSFSAAKYGFDKARELAREARLEGWEKALLAPHLPLPDLARSLARVTAPEPGWEVRWGGQRMEAFLDEDYGALDGKPGSWWAFIEAIARLKAEEISQCGHTQVCSRGAWLKQVYINLIGKEQAR